MTRYLKAYWHHANPDDPVVYLSEIEQGLEVRKVQKYADGSVEWAGPDGQTGDTGLSEGLMPFPSEIDAQDEFTTAPIDAREFETEWLAALAERPGDADAPRGRPRRTVSGAALDLVGPLHAPRASQPKGTSSERHRAGAGVASRSRVASSASSSWARVRSRSASSGCWSTVCPPSRSRSPCAPGLGEPGDDVPALVRQLRLAQPPVRADGRVSSPRDVRSWTTRPSRTGAWSTTSASASGSSPCWSTR